jgi:signal-transduction protein with cAMP-binding, CBS, and nucleotidyltransferase domain
MNCDLGLVSISPSDALQALSKMQTTRSSRLAVTDDGQFLGIVALKDLLRFHHLKLELEDEELKTMT